MRVHRRTPRIGRPWPSHPNMSNRIECSQHHPSRNISVVSSPSTIGSCTCIVLGNSTPPKRKRSATTNDVSPCMLRSTRFRAYNAPSHAAPEFLAFPHGFHRGQLHEELHAISRPTACFPRETPLQQQIYTIGSETASSTSSAAPAHSTKKTSGPKPSRHAPIEQQPQREGGGRNRRGARAASRPHHVGVSRRQCAMRQQTLHGVRASHLMPPLYLACMA